MTKKKTAEPKAAKKSKLKLVAGENPLLAGADSPAGTPEDSSCIPQPDASQSTQSAMTPSETSNQEKNMTLSLKGLDKRGRSAIYTGAAISIRVGLTAFPNKTAPSTIEVADGVFAGPKAKRAAMTPEERKAARAAAPKLTLAEKIAKREAALERDRAKLAKQAPAPAAGM